MIDEDPLVEISPPTEPEPHVALDTQGSTTNTLTNNTTENMESMRVRLEQAESQTANKNW